MVNQALFSNKKDYRYMLSRSWDDSKPTLGLIGLKPSSGDAKKDDNDILEQINIAKSLGYGSLYSLNLFGCLDTQYNVGTNNNKYIKHYISECKVVICAWGDEGNIDNRGDKVKRMFKNLYYLKLNPSGEPTHFSNFSLELSLIKF